MPEIQHQTCFLDMFPLNLFMLDYANLSFSYKDSNFITFAKPFLMLTIKHNIKCRSFPVVKEYHT